MILESRTVVFTNSALKKAFGWYGKVPNQSELPPGVITAVRPQPGGGAVVTVQQSGASRAREVGFTASKTLAVLLFFCRKQRLPIPREADKDIRADGDSLILQIETRTRSVSSEG